MIVGFIFKPGGGRLLEYGRLSEYIRSRYLILGTDILASVSITRYMLQ